MERNLLTEKNQLVSTLGLKYLLSHMINRHAVIRTLLFSLLSVGRVSQSVSQFSRSVMSDSLWPHEPQHTRPPWPSPTPGVYSNSCPSQWCHPTISSSVVPFSSCLQSFPASGSFSVSQLFSSGGQSTGVSASASVHPMNIQEESI